MIAYVHNIVVKRGDTKEIFFRVRTQVWNDTLSIWQPGAYRDLTGWEVLAQIRSTEDSNTVVATFTATLADQVTTTGGVYLKLSPATTAALTVENGVWDCQLTSPSGDVYTYVEGTYTLDKDVSRLP